MATRKPIVAVSGGQQQVQSGDYVDPASLGSGTANSTTYLRGDNTWATPSAGSVGPDVFAFAAAYG